jgi:hypothetical protein
MSTILSSAQVDNDVDDDSSLLWAWTYRAARIMAMDDNDDRNDADRLREIGVISIRTILMIAY